MGVRGVGCLYLEGSCKNVSLLAFLGTEACAHLNGRNYNTTGLLDGFIRESDLRFIENV